MDYKLGEKIMDMAGEGFVVSFSGQKDIPTLRVAVQKDGVTKDFTIPLYIEDFLNVSIDTVISDGLTECIVEIINKK